MNDQNHNLTSAQLNRLMFIMFAMVAVMFAVSAYAWFHLPAGVRIPVHWGLDGQPNRYAGKAEGLLLPPLVAMSMAVVFRIIPIIEPRQRNLLRSYVAYRAVGLSVAGFILALHLLVTARLLGLIHVGMTMIAGVGMGILFMALGNYMGKVRSNFLFGIRTPWTLTSNIAWDKTHRLGGRLMFLTGLAGLVLCPWLGTIGFRILMFSVLAIVLFIVFYSWLVWRSAPDRRRD